MKINLYSTTGKKIDQLDLPREIFAVSASPRLISQAITSYLSNQRQAGAKVKSRGEIAGSGHKIWRQKGTGRARHGDRYAPIFVGGGIAHGPKGNQNFHKKLTKKMKRLSLFAALSLQLKNQAIIAVEGLDKLQPKTKKFAHTFNQLAPKTKNLLLVLPRPVDTIIRGARNLSFVTITQASRLNIYEILKSQKLIFTKDSLEVLKNTFLTKNKPIRQIDKTPPKIISKPSISKFNQATQLSARTLNILKKASLTPSQAKRLSVEKLKAIKGLGPQALAEIKK